MESSKYGSTRAGGATCGCMGLGKAGGEGKVPKAHHGEIKTGAWPSPVKGGSPTGKSDGYYTHAETAHKA